MEYFMSRKKTSRRTFLRGTALLGVGVAFKTIGCAAGLRTIESSTQNGRITVDTVDIKELTAVDDVVQISSTQLNDPIFLVKTGKNEFRAMSSICTHLGCQVRKTRFGFRCPCHGSAFDFNGQVVTGPANEPLPEYNLEVSGTMVMIMV